MDTDYFQHKEICFASLLYSQERLQYLENEFHVLDDDVYLVSYPKSGMIKKYSVFVFALFLQTAIIHYVLLK